MKPKCVRIKVFPTRINTYISQNNNRLNHWRKAHLALWSLLLIAWLLPLRSQLLQASVTVPAAMPRWENASWRCSAKKSLERISARSYFKLSSVRPYLRHFCKVSSYFMIINLTLKTYPNLKWAHSSKKVPGEFVGGWRREPWHNPRHQRGGQQPRLVTAGRNILFWKSKEGSYFISDIKQTSINSSFSVVYCVVLLILCTSEHNVFLNHVMLLVYDINQWWLLTGASSVKKKNVMAANSSPPSPATVKRLLRIR